MDESFYNKNIFVLACHFEAQIRILMRGLNFILKYSINSSTELFFQRPVKMYSSYVFIILSIKNFFIVKEIYCCVHLIDEEGEAAKNGNGPEGVYVERVATTWKKNH